MTNPAKQKFRLDIRNINKSYRPYLKSNVRTQFFFGGSGSGKSVFVAQRAVLDVLTGGRNYLVCREVSNDSRRSTWVEVNKVISAWNLGESFVANKTDLTITAPSGHQFRFIGLDDPEKIKSVAFPVGNVSDIWIEEGTQSNQNTVLQLMRRQRGGSSSVPNRMHITFNPTNTSNYLYREYFEPINWQDDQRRYQNPELSILRTTFEDNDFLTSADKEEMRNEKNEYFKRVYSQGKWGSLSGLVYTNWERADLSRYKKDKSTILWGLDFGYASDSNALVGVQVDEKAKEIRVLYEWGENRLTNDKIASAILPYVNNTLVLCDSSEPKSIDELKNYGVAAHPTFKPRGSILSGIQWLSKYKILVDDSCIGVLNEFASYKWKQARVEGTDLPVPIDKDNHFLDAIRYALSFLIFPPEKRKAEATVIDTGSANSKRAIQQSRQAFSGISGGSNFRQGTRQPAGNLGQLVGSATVGRRRGRGRR